MSETRERSVEIAQAITLHPMSHPPTLVNMAQNFLHEIERNGELRAILEDLRDAIEKGCATL